MIHKHCLLIFLLLLSFQLFLSSCNKDEKDKRADVSATIDETNFSISNAKATLHYESLFSSNGQLTITGSDNMNSLTLIITNFTNEIKGYSIPAEAIAIYTNKTTNSNDTATTGSIQVNFYQDYSYWVPDQPYSTNSSGENHSSELIVGTFDFYTKANVHISKGIYGIVFNK